MDLISFLSYSSYLCTSLTKANVKAAYTTDHEECKSMFDGCSAPAVLHTTSDSKTSWEAVMGSGKTWATWTVEDDL